MKKITYYDSFSYSNKIIENDFCSEYFISKGNTTYYCTLNKMKRNKTWVRNGNFLKFMSRIFGLTDCIIFIVSL